MRRALALATLLLLASGCASPPGDDADGDGDDATRASEADPAVTGDRYYLDYTESCLDQEGRLVSAAPQSRACWHLPGLLLDAPRTFRGTATVGHGAGATVDGLLVVYGQTPSPSDLRLSLQVDGQEQGSADLGQSLVTPLGNSAVPFSFALTGPVAAGAELALVVAYDVPSTTDYIVVGESQLTLT